MIGSQIDARTVGMGQAPAIRVIQTLSTPAQGLHLKLLILGKRVPKLKNTKERKRKSLKRREVEAQVMKGDQERMGREMTIAGQEVNLVV